MTQFLLKVFCDDLFPSLCVIFGNLFTLLLYIGPFSILSCLIFYPSCSNILFSFVAHLQSEPFLQPHVYRPRNVPVSVPQPDLIPGGRRSSSSQRWQRTLALVGDGGGPSRYAQFVCGTDFKMIPFSLIGDKDRFLPGFDNSRTKRPTLYWLKPIQIDIFSFKCGNTRQYRSFLF